LGGAPDDRLAADLATMPWIEFVTVKTAMGADSAALRPVDEARANLTARAQQAVENLIAGKTMSMRAPAPLIRNATRGYASLLGRAAREDPNAAEIFGRFRLLLDETWFDYESGRWERPESPPETADSPRKYHGYQ
jgi:hypothetical protein